MGATTPAARILHHKIEALAGVATVSAGFYFALEYAGSGKWATRRTALLLTGMNLFLALMVATNDLHHLLWTRLWVDGVVQLERGPLNPLLLSLVLLLPFISLLLFLRLLLRSGGIYRWQALLLAIGSALPILTFLLEVANIHLLSPLDPVILMWSLSGLLFALAIFRFRLLAAVPVGRYRAIESGRIGMLILNAEDRIADINPAASEVLMLTRHTAIGGLAPQALADFPALLALLEHREANNAEIVGIRGSQTRHYEVQASPLSHRRSSHLGWLILLQDVTEQRRVQADLLEQRAAVAALREREELARELHDGLGQVLSYVKLQTEAARELLAQNRPEKADVYLAQLAAAAQAAHADVRDYIRAATREIPPAEQGFRAALEQVLYRFSQTHRLQVELELPTDLPDERFEPEATVQLLHIIQEAMTNAHKHAGARRVCVRVIACNGTAEVSIMDDGMGFDPQQTESGGFGLRFMAERAQAVGGRLQIQSARGEGTTVTVQIPLKT